MLCWISMPCVNSTGTMRTTADPAPPLPTTPLSHSTLGSLFRDAPPTMHLMVLSSRPTSSSNSRPASSPTRSCARSGRSSRGLSGLAGTTWEAVGKRGRGRGRGGVVREEIMCLAGANFVISCNHQKYYLRAPHFFPERFPTSPKARRGRCVIRDIHSIRSHILSHGRRAGGSATNSKKNALYNGKIHPPPSNSKNIKK